MGTLVQAIIPLLLYIGNEERDLVWTISIVTLILFYGLASCAAVAFLCKKLPFDFNGQKTFGPLEFPMYFLTVGLLFYYGEILYGLFVFTSFVLMTYILQHHSERTL